MSQITVMRLAELLTQHVGVTFISFTACTRADHYRKNGKRDGLPVVNPHYKRIRKLAAVNVMTDFHYPRRLEKVRAAQGLEMRPIGKSRAGMVHIPGTPLVHSQNGHICLWAEVRSVKAGSVRYYDIVTGNPIDPEILKPFKPARTSEIAYVTYGLETILSITVNGETHDVNTATYLDAKQTILASLHTAVAGAAVAGAAVAGAAVAGSTP